MIAYVDCISSQPAGKCWNRTYYEDEDELLPLYAHKSSNPQSKNGGSLRRRLLTSKIHQQQDRLWHSKYWDGLPALKSTQPLQKQHSSTFKPMQENVAGRASRHCVSWSSFTGRSFINVSVNPEFWLLILNWGWEEFFFSDATVSVVIRWN